MPAVHDRLLSEEFTEIGDEVWVLRAGAIADADGSVMLLLAVDGSNLQKMVSGLEADPGYVSARLVGIDATGVVVPLQESQAESVRPSSETSNLPATLRARHLVVLNDGAVGESQTSVPDGLEGILRSLVSASIGLGGVPRPLARITDVVSQCDAAHLTVASTITIDELRERVQRHVSATGLVVDESPLRSRARHRGDSDSAGRSTPARPLYFRGPALDELALVDGRSVVLQGENATPLLHVLNADVAQVWNRADGVERTRLGGPAGVVDTLLDFGLLDSRPSWRISDDVAWVGDDARTTVLSPDSISPLALVGSSHVVWSVLADRCAVNQDALVDACARLFDADAREIEAPIEALLYDLWGRGLVIRI
ncbi:MULTISPECIES: PqqD family protein [unclassified Microbacterium]|uniref:PqqD family protein n=1 Tax=unclassified Microbacterium TaxID=2609290 RepID=UPI000493748E|nr:MULTISPECIES: PqqD family protein [unclassified Microbacterium]